NVSHEFMLLTPIGEDSIALCTECDYRANMEAAECIIPHSENDVSDDLVMVHTPNIHTIEEVCAFLHCEEKTSCKAVVYQRNADDSYIVLFIRGDLEVNETKLTNYLGCDIHPAVITEECGLNAGYIGPVNLNGDFTVLFDRSLEGLNNLSCGANICEYHYTGLDMARDVAGTEYHDFAKIQNGGICPHCGKPAVTISRGIEVGNIFQLGTKYTKSMNMTYVDSNGETQYPLMGCYGIGIGRLAASICEAHHDEYGPIWPPAVAPWQVHLCAVRSDDAEVKACADRLYEELQSKGIEVIYDDRKVSAGVMFSDADLLGVPFRVIVSPRNKKQNIVEIVSRDKSFTTTAPMETAAEEIWKVLTEQQKQTVK
ncbi:MAG: proline--tRNA ligase, partial [Lachnospiraceae bacterium]|nr:proline--tRNA ligase [Lachnospiraceae bacterium]